MKIIKLHQPENRLYIHQINDTGTYFIPDTDGPDAHHRLNIRSLEFININDSECVFNPLRLIDISEIPTEKEQTEYKRISNLINGLNKRIETECSESVIKELFESQDIEKSPMELLTLDNIKKNVELKRSKLAERRDSYQSEINDIYLTLNKRVATKLKNLDTTKVIKKLTDPLRVYGLSSYQIDRLIGLWERSIPLFIDALNSNELLGHESKYFN